jgi:hypothetical protein
MDIPLIGFVAQVTLFAFPYCWLLQFFEKKIVGVKSEFWDSFLVSFLALIGGVVINVFIMITLYWLPWIVTDFIWMFLSVALWRLLTRKVLKLEPRYCLKISICMVAVLYAVDWLMYLMDFELSVVLW